MFGGTRARLVVGLLLAAFAAPSLLLGGATLMEASLPSGLVVGALGLPLAIIAVALAYIGRQVAAEADEPELVDDRLGERVDMTSEEYRELTED
ncbi:hypothetical protein [Halosegnis sp.]|uniref:hypothetical protein n=1 Tax=Halosegnis sp. TaxID=2864959 RepID=UPI0035D4B5AB